MGLAGPRGPACRWFDIPSPAPPKLIGALLVVATTIGFLVTDRLLASGDSIDHAPGSHDDLANAVAGVLVQVSARSRVPVATVGTFQNCR